MATGGQEEQWPERIIIGTKKAFENGYAFKSEKKEIAGETIYVCSKGSEWARANEVLVLRCENETWTAFDSEVSADGTTLQCRQRVFRCLDADITEPGWHSWQINDLASSDAAGDDTDWRGALSAETRLA